ncbi:MAG: Asp-tRNA(Asn)/Glu-tRNA(Gln) amidotransferase GatCAB subunit A [Candidatus Harrisonbacteria bacterium CG10_big_fil_rev_8_21_14_0_10_40_38]|uniref:Glutamyl-tRNA(Gln) amidotransferase subunit A n=1 Tax=Candidatus Harrisonbacteria bacterium CG10_big_fil_rev_8_21_14_0_10_40_38 TaxID=1974583 RepID=A0A2H0UV76_9BACT|nr:MAG: Asp-tRNA(Asn)/Glu-tRNA(Gln) amidotransferase GatCAB subunit A [Candidatus Harrisonbacteria bacterium CG10_big_fil_rev_8_21_14_0_10_40_38]
MYLHNLTIDKFHEGLVNKEFRALDVVHDYFARIEDKDHEIRAFLNLTKDLAFKQAEEADLAVERGEEISLLAGVPMAIKDNILIKGEQATAGSRILENYKAAYDSTVISFLKKSKAVFLGKTNLDEFAMGSSTENSAFQVSRNPHDTTRVTGGSSGGSAAAVAAHFALASLGSDTGGSIRQPAALCGVVGLKTTYGAVSRFGLIALASSLDQIGPFTRTVRDSAIVFSEIAKKDSLDSTSCPPVYGSELLEPKLEDIKKLRVGIPEEYFTGDLSSEVAEGLEVAKRKLESLGVSFTKISLPHTKYALSVYYIILPAEASANLARFDGLRYGKDLKQKTEGLKLADIYLKNRSYGFGPEPKRRNLIGTFVLSSGYYDAYYTKAQKVRRLIKQDFDEVFKSVDVIFAPTTPTTAFKIGEKAQDPLSMYLSDIFTIPANLAGLPAVSIPVNSSLPGTGAGLPVGFQLIGKQFCEADILGLGQFYEKLS